MSSKARNLSDFISDPAIDSTELGDGSVTTAKLGDQAVTPAKLHNTLDLSSKTVTLATDGISGNSVHGGVISDFASTGIDDNASSTAITIDSDENVGIGTGSPFGDTGSKTLEISHTATARVLVDTTTGSGRRWGMYTTSADGRLGFYDYDASSNRLVIDSSGNVGIGTTSPDQLIHLGATGTNKAGIKFRSNSTDDRNMIIYADDGPGLHISKGDNNTLENSNALFSFRTSGSLGIGVTSPQTSLTIARNVNTNSSTDESAPYVSFQNTSSSYTAGNIIGGLTWFNSSGGHSSGMRAAILAKYSATGTAIGNVGTKLEFKTANQNAGDSNTRMTIDNIGNVGIGTTGPLDKLHVEHDSTEIYSSTLTKGTNTQGLWVTNDQNGDNMAGIHLATGSGTHFSSVVGARTNNGSHWGTHLSFYTHRNDTNALNTASERMRLDGSGSLEQYGSSVKSMYFPVFLESTQTHHIATATNLDNATVLIATLEFATLYAYAGSQHSMGTIWASARRINNNTAWRELNQATVNIGDTGYTPGFYWDTSNGQLKCSVGGSVQVTGFIRITYHNCDVTRVTN